MPEFMDTISGRLNRVIVDLKQVEQRIDDPVALESVDHALNQIAQLSDNITGLVQLQELLEEMSRLEQDDSEDLDMTAPLKIVEGLDSFQFN
ncbi:MAG: hypothetical protein QF898_10700 [SAR202 cluster bacterium]|jgi:hypothetical protein|nr:hypothetical protein [SAR202 cluster bacterium]MDP6514803.1 hypothetical protein [SAR202 cluster bacterium]MDP6713108.1 hypothetical protein [SAR202 cluster bacterium]|tara:strand:+ start:353 stop:628 length:276 start_codon:yes stop_codon:yes gene_type:complete